MARQDGIDQPNGPAIRSGTRLHPPNPRPHGLPCSGSSAPLAYPEPPACPTPSGHARGRPRPPRRPATPASPVIAPTGEALIVADMQSYTIGQAARLLGVSPDTARRWADAGRVATHRDETGRRLIDGKDLAEFSVELAGSSGGEEGASYTSARNAFPGIVTAIKLGDVAAQVEIQAGPHRLVSLLTREAVEELGLEVGMEATARVKSTNVHIDRV